MHAKERNVDALTKWFGPNTPQIANGRSPSNPQRTQNIRIWAIRVESGVESIKQVRKELSGVVWDD